MFRFWITLENSSGDVVGQPITSAYNFQHTRRMSRAGEFSFSMPAEDPQSANVAARLIARCYAVIDGAVTEIGAGIIDRITRTANQDGAVTLTASGDDLLRELTYRQVGTLAIDNGAGGATTAGVALIMAKAPAGWSVSGSSAVSLLHAFEGETVLAALVRLAEITGEAFRLGSGRSVTWITSDVDSGIVLLYGLGVASSATIGTVIDVTIEHDSYSEISRVYPVGVGTGSSQLTLDGATFTPPAGYAINTTDNYIAISPETNRVDEYLSLKDVQNPDALAQAAYTYLSQRVNAGEFYNCQCLYSGTLQPGQTARLVARKFVDGVEAVNVDESLTIIEATVRVDAAGLRVVAVQLSNVRRYPYDDAQGIVSAGGTSRDAYTYPQPGQAANIDTGTVNRLAKYTLTDKIGQSGIADSVSGGVLSLAATLTTNRTLTVPDAAGTLALLEQAQTFTQSQRVGGGTEYFVVSQDGFSGYYGSALKAQLIVGATTLSLRGRDTHSVSIFSGDAAGGTVVRLNIASGATPSTVNASNSSWLWTTAGGTCLYVRYSNDRVAIGTTSPGGRFDVRGAADEIQQIIRAHSAQTADLLQVQTSAGVKKVYVDSTYKLTAESFAAATTALATNLNADLLDGYHASAMLLTVEETDGTPSVAGVTKIKVSNGRLTDDGSGVVSVSIPTTGDAWIKFDTSTTTAGIDYNRVTTTAYSYVEGTLVVLRPIKLVKFLWDIRVAGDYTLEVFEAGSTSALHTITVTGVSDDTTDCNFSLSTPSMIAPGIYTTKMTCDSPVFWWDYSAATDMYFPPFIIIDRVYYEGASLSLTQPYKLEYYDSTYEV